MKKAYELSILCGCEVAVILIAPQSRIYQFASTDMDSILMKYTCCKEPPENDPDLVKILVSTTAEEGGDLGQPDEYDEEAEEEQYAKSLTSIPQKYLAPEFVPALAGLPFLLRCLTTLRYSCSSSSNKETAAQMKLFLNKASGRQQQR